MGTTLRRNIAPASQYYMPWPAVYLLLSSVTHTSQDTKIYYYMLKVHGYYKQKPYQYKCKTDWVWMLTNFKNSMKGQSKKIQKIFSSIAYAVKTYKNRGEILRFLMSGSSIPFLAFFFLYIELKIVKIEVSSTFYLRLRWTWASSDVLVQANILLKKEQVSWQWSLYLTEREVTVINHNAAEVHLLWTINEALLTIPVETGILHQTTV